MTTSAVNTRNANDHYGTGAAAAASGPSSRIPVLRSLEEIRSWRKSARENGLEVGIVPTMGALHEGHLNLVRTSMSNHPLTVMTLFVNPMQFAPNEDLSKYPRTLASDLRLLETLLPPSDASPLVVWTPDDTTMYPLKGEMQDLTKKRGVEVDVKGYGDVMEGKSRPQFFKGVATVCTKLFNAVEPDHAYFGQKDIQQALLLRIMLKDLLLSHPLPDNLHILPTTRSASHLALSSRNAYLSPAELAIAPVLYQALSAARGKYEVAFQSGGEGVTAEDMSSAAEAVVRTVQAQGEGVEVSLDYFEVFDRDTLQPIRDILHSRERREMVVAGAVWVGKTRLIDNLLLGWGVD